MSVANASRLQESNGKDVARFSAGTCRLRDDDGDSRGRSLPSRKGRRASLMARPLPDKATRIRRRHSFMLPNGSDVHPARFVGWPTIVEEGLQLTDTATTSDASSTKTPSLDGTNPFAAIMRPFVASSMNSGQKLIDSMVDGSSDR